MLQVSEIFLSLQGESRSVGFPTVFIRLTGCHLRCSYCDTQYSFHGGDELTIAGVIQQVKQYSVPRVMVTGGEPLSQKPSLELMSELCDLGYEVSLESSGALDISQVDKRVTKIIDLKTPDSKMEQHNLYSNISCLTPKDQIKFVLCSCTDYEWAVTKISKYKLDSICELIFSPVTDKLEPKLLADWIVADRLPVRFQLQLHKQIWGDERGR